MNGVSIVVCCYNSALRLPKTLEHLAGQKGLSSLRCEVIVIDNASTDNTQQVAIEEWKMLNPAGIDFRVVSESTSGLLHARKRGISEANYEFVIFCDDDNWLSENYVYNAWSFMSSDPLIGALGGTGSAVADTELPAWFETYKGCYACYPQSDHDGEITKTDAFLYGAGLVVRREVLARLFSSGFVPLLSDRSGGKLTSGGDVELSYALRLMGYQLWYSSKLEFRHYLPAARLTESYLYDLVSSMSYCSGTLMCYIYAITGKYVNTRVWWKDVAYQLFFLIRAVIRYPFGDRSMDSKLGLAFSYNRTRSILHQIINYASRYQQVVKLKPSGA